MPRRGKKYRAAAERAPREPVGIESAMKTVREIAWAGFDESVEVAMQLGVDPRHADQMVRGTVVLPHGTGRDVRVLAICGADQLQAAKDAGADLVMSGEEAVEKISGGFLEFDAVVATPDMMRHIGRLGRVLGPRGLMPNPKTGTVTPNIGDAVKAIKAGKVEFRVSKTKTIHGVIGKKSFEPGKLEDNFRAFVGAVQRAKPPAAKGRYIQSVHVATTMSPSLEIDLAEIERLQTAESA
ncbi:MAG: 50S ribosomal protein L1 [Acidobacteria bacterium]|nr:MAG: 50S ribosomal protein L1 [Acidobacteriota bacterium]